MENCVPYHTVIQNDIRKTFKYDRRDAHVHSLTHRQAVCFFLSVVGVCGFRRTGLRKEKDGRYSLVEGEEEEGSDRGRGEGKVGKEKEEIEWREE